MYRILETTVKCVVLFILFQEISSANVPTLQSPCPLTFQYSLDENGVLFGTIVADSPNESIIQMDVELSVGNPVQGYNGIVELAQPRAQAVADIFMRKPIKYKLHFPQWMGIPPKVTKISMNGNILCAGPPISNSGIVTTITLQHKLKLDIPPGQSPSTSFTEQDEQLTRNQFLYPSSGSSQRRGITDFNPKAPNDFSKLYTGNPFFSSLSSTSRPKSFGEAESRMFDDNDEDTIFINEKAPVTTTKSPKIDRKTAIDFSDRLLEVKSNPPFLESNFLNVPFSDECGRSTNSNTLIVRGEAVQKGAFPWLVAMFVIKNLGPEFRCSGSLITNKHVITAAHCLRASPSIKVEEILLILGKVNIRNWYSENGLQLGAEKFDIHPDYQPLSADADIGIITMNKAIEFTKFIRPVCLWTGKNNLRDIVDQIGTVVGWGKNEEGDYMTQVPKKVNLPVVSQEDCIRSQYSYKDITSDSTFCAGYRNGSGPCNGDSGGGFLMQKNDRWVLRGIVSTSLLDKQQKTCDLNNYVVFTDASKYIDWILSKIK